MSSLPANPTAILIPNTGAVALRGLSWLLAGVLMVKAAFLLGTSGMEAATLFSALERMLTAGLLFAAGWLVPTHLQGPKRLVDAVQAQEEKVSRGLDLLEKQLLPALEQLTRAVEARPEPATNGPKAGELSNLSTTELLEQLQAAKKIGDADEVLDLRAALAPRLGEAKRLKLERELGDWLMKFFQGALRSGKAPLVAAALGRAVDELSEVAEMQHLAEALPMVRRSAGLCVSCGKPYRGRDAQCPVCLAAAADQLAEPAAGDDE